MGEKIKSWLTVGIIPAIIAGAYYVSGSGTDLGGAAVIFAGHYVMLALLVSGANKLINALRSDYDE